ncbi:MULTISPECIES: phosphoribosylamine--glycine ligase [unclassified Methanoregula]|uniref:phosphoribosylamine--glycine ligase n=1 Tax=unclassified Methanoregula TaxID=2649730 RepID=UPI0009CE877B|nr:MULTISPECIES: phosphoribosylamine--glycine ligase [unclassified Methanoregula]OPX62936.1 MAG: phosphoribosylamine--glycine ligase [Methanoregula sp. PtaB.Bin085]OPY35149.1 MAG: phosphoribosylamine--glycine ligase [Methanoregula sp. PtaU1.Bin006]
MKILVVGGGGREHAIAAALSRNTSTAIYSVMAKRNPGIDALAKKVLLCRETDVGTVVGFAQGSGVEYAFIGPEAPLEAGIVDALTAAGIPCIGPTRAAARLETDKAFCREMMDSNRLDGCPLYRVFHSESDAVRFIEGYDGDLVVKPIGLTGGKGVRIMGEQVDRAGAIAYARSLGGNVVLEERLLGEEFTLQAFVDGKHLVPMPLVQDHKRAFEGDTGPNTGGMGSYSMPDHMLPFVSKKDYSRALAIMQSVVAAMDRMGSPYRGILYGQFMNTLQGPRVIEFNARFGDPEAMNVLSLLSSDLTEIVCRIAEGALTPSCATFKSRASVCKYLVPKGYPDAPHAGDPITIPENPRALLYYANVEKNSAGSLSTLTSRTLAYVGIGETLDEAEHHAEEAAAGVKGEVRYRRDIGTPALLERRITHMKELR